MSNAAAYRAASSAESYAFEPPTAPQRTQKAEQAPLENIAKPLTAEEAESGEPAGAEDADADEATSAERRWRERDERRARRERTGRHRYRPGPGPGETFYSPGMLGTAVRSRTAHPSLLDREIDSIAAAVEESGALAREEPARRVGARRWGPGRFQNALASALDEGRVRRVGRGRYGPPEPGKTG